MYLALLAKPRGCPGSTADQLIQPGPSLLTESPCKKYKKCLTFSRPNPIWKKLIKINENYIVNIHFYRLTIVN